VGSPSLAQRSRLTSYGRQIDAFDPFSSELSIDRASHLNFNKASPGSYTIVDDVALQREGFYERSESATVFHDHDRRLGLDPNRRFCPTPGQGLSHDSLLLVHTHSGLSSPSKVVFGPDDIPFGERNSVRPAGPVYNPDWDSKQIKPTIKLSKISPSERKTYLDLQIARSRKEEEGRPDSPHAKPSLHGSTISSAPATDGARSHKPTQQQQQQQQQQPSAVSPIRMPALRSRKPPTLRFDSSCYKALAPERVELNPKNIKKLARVGIFNELLAQRREYDSAKMKSLISEKIRRAAL
jgi:hypothetical protein